MMNLIHVQNSAYEQCLRQVSSFIIDLSVSEHVYYEHVAETLVSECAFEVQCVTMLVRMVMQVLQRPCGAF
eukprot:1598400-Amphidinium_carterae.2